jgi:hypothetical protein
MQNQNSKGRLFMRSDNVDLVSEQIDSIRDRIAWSKTPEGIQINAEVEQLRKTHGPALKYLEDAAYFTGHMDGRKGTIPRTIKCSPVAADGVTKSVTGSGNSSQPSPGELADRAAAYQADKAKAGIRVSNMDAVRFVYEQAGVPLG